MQSFRVDDGVIHETYKSRDGEGPLFYGSLSSGTFRSVKIPGAESTSLRVGDDGQARIAYTTSDSVRYATVRHDGRLSVRSLFRSREMQLSSPSLVLGAGDRRFRGLDRHTEMGRRLRRRGGRRFEARDLCGDRLDRFVAGQADLKGRGCRDTHP